MNSIPYERRNFNALVWDVSFFSLGIAFLDTSTVLPVLVRALGGNESTLGLVLALRQAALYLPPLISGHRLQGRREYLPHLLKIAMAGRLFLVPASLAVLVWGRTNPALALAVFAISYVLSWAGDGAGAVPWAALIGRAIPLQRRGRLFAVIQAASGAVRFGAGFLVTPMLAGVWLLPPGNLGAMVGFSFLSLLVSWIGLAAMKEPPAIPASQPIARLGFSAYLRRLPSLLRRHPALGILAGAQVLGTASMATLPFVAHAARNLDLTPAPWLAPLLKQVGAEGTAGLFLLASVAGQMLSAPFWGRTTDRRGPRTTLIRIYLLGILAPAAAWLGIVGGGGLTPFLAAYFLLGAVGDAWSTTLNYQLEVVHRSGENETDAIALMNVASVPSLLLPLAAGFLASKVGLAAPFVFAVALLCGAVFLATRLPDTRVQPAP
jgi:MFS family permease